VLRFVYVVQCTHDSHELHNMEKGPDQRRDIDPAAPSKREGDHKNAFHCGKDHLVNCETERLLPRIDELLLVLKSCTREARSVL